MSLRRPAFRRSPGSTASILPRKSGTRSRRGSPSAPNAAPLELEHQGAPTLTDARTVRGEPLAECCTRPMTGFYRDGSCNTGPEDVGVHTVCTKVDAAFLAFLQSAGNDLSTPV